MTRPCMFNCNIKQNWIYYKERKQSQATQSYLNSSWHGFYFAIYLFNVFKYYLPQKTVKKLLWYHQSVHVSLWHTINWCWLSWKPQSPCEIWAPINILVSWTGDYPLCHPKISRKSYQTYLSKDTKHDQQFVDLVLHEMLDDIPNMSPYIIDVRRYVSNIIDQFRSHFDTLLTD